MDHALTGYVVRGRIREITYEAPYNLSAIITTGTLTGHECLVLYRGNLSKLEINQEVLVRLQPSPQPGYPSLEERVTGNLITPQPKGNITTLSPHKALFYATWEERMSDGDAIPTFQRIENFFDIGALGCVAFFLFEDYRIKPFSITKRTLMAYDKGMPGRRKPLTPRRATRKYLEYLNRIKTSAPRLFLIDCRAPQEEILEAIKEHHPTPIKLEPHQ